MTTCLSCGSPFDACKTSKQYCSEKCRKREEKRRGKLRARARQDEERKARKGLEWNEQRCGICSTVFPRYTDPVNRQGWRKYCSDQCSNKAHYQHKVRRQENKPARKIDCAHCETTFEPWGPQKYCSDGCRREATTHRQRIGTYSLSQEEYEALLERSGGLCEICQEKEVAHIDHCHDTGAVRGLLCQQCNHGLGNFQDRVALLNRASEYLSKKLA